MNHPHPEFVFLGFSANCAEVLERGVSNGGRCSGIYVDNPHLVPESYKSNIRALDDWPELLAVDSNLKLFVALSLNDDSHQDIVRSLVSNGSSLIFIDPDADSLFAYELEMIRTEADGELSTLYFEALSTRELGSIFHQINIRESAGTRHLETVTIALTRDLLQLRTIVGESKSLYALSPGTVLPISPAAELDISITLEMRGGTILQWANSDKSHSNTQYTFPNEHKINPIRSYACETTDTQLAAIFSSQNNDLSPTWL